MARSKDNKQLEFDVVVNADGNDKVIENQVTKPIEKAKKKTDELKGSYKEAVKSSEKLVKSTEDLHKELKKVTKEKEKQDRQIERLKRAALEHAAKEKEKLAIQKEQTKEIQKQARETEKELKSLQNKTKGLDLTDPKQISLRMSTIRSSMRALEMQRSQIGGLAKTLDSIVSGTSNRLATLLSYKTLGGLTNMMTGSLGSLTDIQQGFQNISAITNATSAAMEKLRDSVFEVGKSSSFTIEELQKATVVIGQAGYSAKDAAAILKDVSTLATATATSLDTTVNVVTSSLSVWNKTASQSAHIADVLTTAVNKSKAEIGTMANAIQYAGAAAADMGISFEEFVSISSAVTNAGMKARSVVGTGFRSVLTELVNPTDKLNKMFNRLGLTLEDVNVRALGITKVLQNLKDAGLGADEAFSSFDRRAASFYLAATAQLDSAKQLNTYFLEQGSAMEAQSRQMDTLQSQWTAFNNIMKNVMSEVFRPLVAALTAILKMINGVLGTAFGRFILKAVTLVTTFKTLVALTKGSVEGFKKLQVITAAGIKFLEEYVELAKKQNDLDKQSVENKNQLARATKAANTSTAAGFVGGSAQGELFPTSALQTHAQIMEKNRKTFSQFFKDTKAGFKNFTSSLTKSTTYVNAFKGSVSKMGVAFTVAARIGVTALNMLKAAIASTGIGLIMVGIGTLIEHIMSLGDSLEKVQDAMNSNKDLMEEVNEAYTELTDKSRLYSTDSDALRLRIAQLNQEFGKQSGLLLNLSDTYEDVLTKMNQFKLASEAEEIALLKRRNKALQNEGAGLFGKESTWKRETREMSEEVLQQAMFIAMQRGDKTSYENFKGRLEYKENEKRIAAYNASPLSSELYQPILSRKLTGSVTNLAGLKEKSNKELKAALEDGDLLKAFGLIDKLKEDIKNYKDEFVKGVDDPLEKKKLEEALQAYTSFKKEFEEKAMEDIKTNSAHMLTYASDAANKAIKALGFKEGGNTEQLKANAQTAIENLKSALAVEREQRIRALGEPSKGKGYLQRKEIIESDIQAREDAVMTQYARNLRKLEVPTLEISALMKELSNSSSEYEKRLSAIKEKNSQNNIASEEYRDVLSKLTETSATYNDYLNTKEEIEKRQNLYLQRQIKIKEELAKLDDKETEIKRQQLEIQKRMEAARQSGDQGAFEELMKLFETNIANLEQIANKRTGLREEGTALTSKELALQKAGYLLSGTGDGGLYGAFAKFGDGMGLGAWNGMAQSADDLKKSLQALDEQGNVTMQTLTQMSSKELLGTFTDSFSNAAQAVVTGASTIKDAVKDMVTNILNSMAKFLADLAVKAAVLMALNAIPGMPAFLKAMDASASIIPVGAQAATSSTTTKASGGPVVGGIPGRDSVNAKLMPGEYVLKKSAVDYLGKGFLNDLNNNTAQTMGAVAGGVVEGDDSPASVVNVWVVSEKQDAGMGPNDVIATISRDIRTGGQTRQLIKSVIAGRK